MSLILLVDDGEEIRGAIKKVLEVSGHRVTEARDGKVAMKAIAQVDFDVIITDIFMPEMDGLELIMAIRERAPKTKIIAMSSGGEMQMFGILKTARHFGACKILDKPFEVQELLDAVEEVVNSD